MALGKFKQPLSIRDQRVSPAGTPLILISPAEITESYGRLGAAQGEYDEFPNLSIQKWKRRLADNWVKYIAVAVIYGAAAWAWFVLSLQR